MIISLFAGVAFLLAGCTQQECLEYTKIKQVTPVKVNFHEEYLVQYENNTFEQFDSTTFMRDKCVKYK